MRHLYTGDMVDEHQKNANFTLANISYQYYSYLQQCQFVAVATLFQRILQIDTGRGPTFEQGVLKSNQPNNHRDNVGGAVWQERR